MKLAILITGRTDQSLIVAQAWQKAQGFSQNLQHLYATFTAPLRLPSQRLSYCTASRQMTSGHPSL